MKKRIISAFLAFIMVFAIVVPLVRADEVNKKTKSVIVHKLLMTKEKLDKWKDNKELLEKYDGSQNFEAFKKLLTKNDLKEISGAYFALQRKSSIDDSWSYIDDNGKVVQKLEDAYGILTTDTGAEFKVNKLSNGYYRLVEVKEKSTYNNNGAILADSLAVPVEFALPFSDKKGNILEKVHVYPKNTEEKPQIDKNFDRENNLKDLSLEGRLSAKEGSKYNNYNKEKARVTADLGTDIPYEVKTKVNSGTEYKKLVWKDSVTNGLTFNKDIKITVDNGISLDTEEDYRILSDDRGFTLILTYSGLEKVKKVTKAGKDVEFTLKYSAKLNGNAIVDNPEKNEILLEYGNKPYDYQEPKKVKPENDKLKVEKRWALGSESNNVRITYILRNSKDSYSVTLDKNTQRDNEIDLGNGVKFKLGRAFSGEFIGLSKNENWTLEERVAGYKNKINNSIDGKVEITNTLDNDNPTPIKPTQPEVVVGGKRFVKVDKISSERLVGAKFRVKKGNYYLVALNNSEKDANNKASEARKQLDRALVEYNFRKNDYNKQELLDNINKAQEKFNRSFISASMAYKWINKVELEKYSENLVILSSNENGKFEIKGLEYGDYEIEEFEAPKGYALTDGQSFKFTVGNGTYDSKGKGIAYEPVLMKEGVTGAQRIDNKKISIPQTGGIGTVIFTVAGLIIMGAAIYALKKNNQEVDA